MFYFHLRCKTLFLPSVPPGYGQLPCSVTVLWRAFMYMYVRLKMYELSCGEATLWAGGQGYLRLRVCVICALTSLGLAYTEKQRQIHIYILKIR